MKGTEALMATLGRWGRLSLCQALAIVSSIGFFASGAGWRGQWLQATVVGAVCGLLLFVACEKVLTMADDEVAQLPSSWYLKAFLCAVLLTLLTASGVRALAGEAKPGRPRYSTLAIVLPGWIILAFWAKNTSRSARRE
jgi:hypothetical protein